MSLALTNAGCVTGEGLAGVWKQPIYTPLTVHSSGVVLASVTHTPTHTPGGCIHVWVKVAFRGMTIAVAGCRREGIKIFSKSMLSIFSSPGLY